MSLLNKLENLQSEYGYLPKGKLKLLAENEGISLAQLIGTASFYEFFSFEEGISRVRIEDIWPCRKAGILLNAPEKYSWAALSKAGIVPEKVIPALKEAGLTGRGGGDFPVWKKWQAVRDAEGDVKYVICNADEGEPGTGKDRVLIRSNPNAIIEGMAVCAAVVGAKKGFIYLRGEYADLRDELEGAIAAAPLGEFEIEVILGHGAYVCGEETALLNSIEGRRGEPRLKPPYPGEAGLWGKPTVVNNAESFANVPFIIEFGAENYRRRGIGQNTGTRLYTVFGAVKKPGVYELEAGATTSQLLAAAGGATAEISAMLVGGGSGELLRPELDVTVKGTGSVRFICKGEKLVGVVRELIDFYSAESCGMCVPCRIGLKKLASMLEKVENGQYWQDDIDSVRLLSEHIRENARCGLAKAAVIPVIGLINNFPEVLE